MSNFKSCAQDVMERVAGLSADYTIGRNFFLAREPQDIGTTVDDTTFTFYDTGGSEELTDENIKYSTFQVRSRGKDYRQVFDKICDIAEKILRTTSFTANSVKYVGIWSTTDILSLGLDDNERYRLVQNFRATRQYIGN